MASPRDTKTDTRKNEGLLSLWQLFNLKERIAAVENAYASDNSKNMFAIERSPDPDDEAKIYNNNGMRVGVPLNLNQVEDKYRIHLQKIRQAFSELEKINKTINDEGRYKAKESTKDKEIRTKEPQVDKQGELNLTSLIDDAVIDTVFNGLKQVVREFLNNRSKRFGPSSKPYQTLLTLESLIDKTKGLCKINKETWRKEYSAKQEAKRKDPDVIIDRNQTPSPSSDTSLDSLGRHSPDSASSLSSSTEFKSESPPSSPNELKKVLELERENEALKRKRMSDDKEFKLLLAKAMELRENNKLLELKSQLLEQDNKKVIEELELVKIELKNSVAERQSQDLVVAELKLQMQKLTAVIEGNSSPSPGYFIANVVKRSSSPAPSNSGVVGLDSFVALAKKEVQTSKSDSYVNHSEQKEAKHCESKNSNEAFIALQQIINDTAYWKSKSRWTTGVPKGIENLQKLIKNNQTLLDANLYSLLSAEATKRQAVSYSFFKDRRDPMTAALYKIFNNSFEQLNADQLSSIQKDQNQFYQPKSKSTSNPPRPRT